MSGPLTIDGDVLATMEVGPVSVMRVDQSPEDFAKNQVRFLFENRARITNVNELVMMFGRSLAGGVQRRMVDRDSAELIHQDVDAWVETFLDGVQDVLTVAAITDGDQQRTVLRHSLGDLAALIAEWAIDNERTDR